MYKSFLITKHSIILIAYSLLLTNVLNICYPGSYWHIYIWCMSVNKWHMRIFTCALRSGMEVFVYVES